MPEQQTNGMEGGLYPPKKIVRVVIDLTEDARCCVHCQKETVEPEDDDYIIEGSGGRDYPVCAECVRTGQTGSDSSIDLKNVRKIHGLRDPCSICNRTIDNPSRPRSCGHVFCQNCLYSAREYLSSCPACRTPCCQEQHCKSSRCVLPVKSLKPDKLKLIILTEWVKESENV
ncbi:uncharacterized protein F4822DRAFT_431828 [Hypoxylon trugodes]|uniref:uncharacterized protein n=1 Tax=Hypoxylon trugodes TaxID=326681 RepID=UPI00219991F7|nr:uncharacterized protein F4822DRAFT_431828 [Hypoxylon trugodes]KAI1386962.1 hypothetical protein F4822DRAFT_431828 [Hypoxylon trugodes]